MEDKKKKKKKSCWQIRNNSSSRGFDSSVEKKKKNTKEFDFFKQDEKGAVHQWSSQFCVLLSYLSDFDLSAVHSLLSSLQPWLLKCP